MTGVGLNFDDFFANALETCKYEGRLYQVPMDTRIMGVKGRNWIFVFIETDAGITGIGEATTEYQEIAVAAAIEQHFAPVLLVKDPRPPGLASRLLLLLRADPGCAHGSRVDRGLVAVFRVEKWL